VVCELSFRCRTELEFGDPDDGVSPTRELNKEDVDVEVGDETDGSAGWGVALQAGYDAGCRCRCRFSAGDDVEGPGRIRRVERGSGAAIWAFDGVFGEGIFAQESRFELAS
jgi:hypothetical protein